MSEFISLLTRKDLRAFFNIKSDTLIRRLEKEGKLHQIEGFKCRYDPKEVFNLTGIETSERLFSDDYSLEAWK